MIEFQLLYLDFFSVDVLQVFLALVDPLEERENLAKKFSVHTIVVDVCVLNRDRIALGIISHKMSIITIFGHTH